MIGRADIVAPPSNVPPLVLLVDRHADTRDLYRYWLEQGGLDVVEATSADEALALVTLLSPRIVATELALAGIDGWELCRRLRQQPETSSIPIIAVTALAMAGQVQRAWDAGCDAVLLKPCAPDTLLVEILRLIGVPAVTVARSLA